MNYVLDPERIRDLMERDPDFVQLAITPSGKLVTRTRRPISRRSRMRNGQGYLKQTVRCTYRTVQTSPFDPGSLVPRIKALHGTFSFGDMLSDNSIRNLITAYNRMEGRQLNVS